MSHEIRYDLANVEAQRAACLDVLQWFNKPSLYKMFARMIKFGSPDGAYTEQQVRFYMSLAGVQGYPVGAMIDRYSLKSVGRPVSDGEW